MEVEEEVVEVEEGAEAEVEEQPQREEETRNSSEQNHLLLVGIVKTSIGSFRIFRDICP